ncbi:hypothetical protein IAE20_16265 [Acinetobacter sp. S54]|nr:hypothetical protein [Acinetobacter sp. S55]MBK0068458.1 hypothetical protein [Acinetobacter sp. S54]
MKSIKLLAMIIAYSVSFNICNAKESSLWDDYLQDATQVNSPIEYIGTYNKYSAINPNLKIMLRDFGDINKKKILTIR